MKRILWFFALIFIITLKLPSIAHGGSILLWPSGTGQYPASPYPSPSIAFLDVNLVPQHRDWWCWAAVAEMISAYHGHRVDQCDSANFKHGIPPNCCTGCTGNCPGWGEAWGANVDDIINNWNHWNFSYSYQPRNLTWDELRQAIYPVRSPIEVIWWWLGPYGGGHVVMVRGYEEKDGIRLVHYNDPWPPDCQQPATPGQSCQPQQGGRVTISGYEAFVDDGVHQWGHSFYDFRRTTD